MLGVIPTAVILFTAFLAWLVTRYRSKSKQSDFPLLLIYEGVGFLGSGILGSFDYDVSLNISTNIGAFVGYIKSPDTNYVLIGCGVFFTILGITLWQSLRKRVYVLNMLGRVKHEISDMRTVDSLRLKDYQLKETVLDLRWAANDVNQQTWGHAKSQIEEYIGEFSARSDGSTVCFTGMAPIPFEVYAGTCMTGHTIKRFFEYKRSEDSYYELVDKGSCSPVGWLKREKVSTPTASISTGDDSSEIVIAVSISQTILDCDLTQFDCPKVRLAMDNPKDNFITSITQLRDCVDRTIELIMETKEVYPSLVRIHLVSAVPSCYAFELGCKLGHLDNRFPEIVVHHYASTASPKYRYGIVVTGVDKGNLVINSVLFAGL